MLQEEEERPLQPQEEAAWGKTSRPLLPKNCTEGNPAVTSALCPDLAPSYLQTQGRKGAEEELVIFRLSWLPCGA